MAKPPHFIRQWRKYRKLTLEQLSERVGMTHQNLGKVERFRVPYSQPLLERLAVALETDPASLIMRDPSAKDGLWRLYVEATPEERERAARVLQALRDEKAG